MNSVENYSQCEHHNVFKVRLAILEYYAWKG